MSTGETPIDVIRELAGGPAFPSPEMHSGMTLRQYYAGQAIVECIRVAEGQTPQQIRDPKLSVLFDKAAAYAFAVADSMLKAEKARAA